MLNTLVASEDITGGINKGLTVLTVNFLAEIVGVLLKELLVLKHVSDLG